MAVDDGQDGVCLLLLLGRALVSVDFELQLIDCKVADGHARGDKADEYESLRVMQQNYFRQQLRRPRIWGRKEGRHQNHYIPKSEERDLVGGLAGFQLPEGGANE